MVAGRATFVFPGASLGGSSVLLFVPKTPAIDGRGASIVGSAGVVAGGNSSLAFGHQTPHLATNDAPTTSKLGLTPRLPNPERVAIGLSCRGSNAGGEKVTGDVTGKIHISRTARNVDGWPRLTGGSVELRQIALWSPRHG